jgi:ABC-type proline/glycine betaine transport system permease subunit
MDVPERFEQLIAFLASQLPAPVDQQTLADNSIQFTAGDPPAVVALLTHSSVVVSEFAGVWETPFTFVPKPRRVGIVKWRRLPENALLAAISALIKGAREARLSSFQTCQFCGQRTAPEWLYEEGLCQSCADQQSGRVH